jgi:hypothetical protein
MASMTKVEGTHRCRASNDSYFVNFVLSFCELNHIDRSIAATLPEVQVADDAYQRCGS